MQLKKGVKFFINLMRESLTQPRSVSVIDKRTGEVVERNGKQMPSKADGKR